LFFHGKKILTEVIRYIFKNRKLKKKSEIYLAGSSAGGIGVINNIDELQKIFKRRKKIKIRGIVDSAYFLIKNKNQKDELKKGLRKV
jgi:hypothetical protein